MYRINKTCTLTGSTLPRLSIEDKEDLPAQQQISYADEKEHEGRVVRAASVELFRNVLIMGWFKHDSDMMDPFKMLLRSVEF